MGGILARFRRVSVDLDLGCVLLKIYIQFIFLESIPQPDENIPFILWKVYHNQVKINHSFDGKYATLRWEYIVHFGENIVYFRKVSVYIWRNMPKVLLYFRPK